MVKDRKEEIVQVAFHLFAEKGCQVSMSDIAGEIGIKTPSLYSHFKNKEEIIYLVVEKLIVDLFDHLDRAVDSTQHLGCEQALKSVFFGSMEFSTYDRLRVSRRIPFIEKRHLRDRCIGAMQQREMEFIERLSGIIREGVRIGEISEEVEPAALISFIAMLQGNLDGKLFYINFVDVEELYEKSWTFFWNGIRKRTLNDCECFNK